MNIQVFIGVIGSGKDHHASQLVETGDYSRVDFKDALLDLASDIAGYDVREDYVWFKSHVVGLRRPNNPLATGMLESEWKDITTRHPGLMTGRDFLTRLGTEGMRKRDEYYWVKQFTRSATLILAEGKSVVNADCRFFNEIQSIMDMKDVDGRMSPAKFTFCNFKSTRYDANLNHASEKLAQTLLAIGLKDEQEIELKHFQEAQSRMGKGA